MDGVEQDVRSFFCNDRQSQDVTGRIFGWGPESPGF
jgi:hypothetical protein